MNDCHDFVSRYYNWKHSKASYVKESKHVWSWKMSDFAKDIHNCEHELVPVNFRQMIRSTSHVLEYLQYLWPVVGLVNGGEARSIVIPVNHDSIKHAI